MEANGPDAGRHGLYRRPPRGGSGDRTRLWCAAHAAGIPGDNTYSNYREANLAYWRLTILPLVRKTLGRLEAWLNGARQGSISLRPDLDAVPALGPEREALWKRLNSADFLTRNEKREIAGLPPIEEVEGNAD